MSGLACIVLFALGHLVRDGWPATGSTQLARAIGGGFAIAGAAFASPHAVLLGLAVWAGFYADQKHGEGQRGATWKDAAYLTLSGVTSLVPLACAEAWFNGPWSFLLLAAGLLKAPIWFGWWHSPVQQLGPWFQPTRLAALAFGALVGLVVVAAP